MRLLFWLAAGLVLYTYFGYPLVLWACTRIHSRHVQKREFFPHVSIIIAARNEAGKIRRKIDGTLALNYPAERLEVNVDRLGNLVHEWIEGHHAGLPNGAADRAADMQSIAPAPH